MTSTDDFTTTQSFTTPVTTSIILTLPTPSAVVTDITLSASDVYRITVYPSSVVTQVTLSGKSSTVTSMLTIPAPRPTVSSSTHVSVAAPAALGAVLGLVTLASAMIIILLARKTRQLIRSSRHVEELRTVHGPPETNYALYAKEDIRQEESPSELRRQLEAVRAELTAIRVLAPSTIRDQSDYVRDLTVLNDNIRQLSLRVSSTRSRLSAATIRSKLCEALWSDIFAKFDAGLDAATERQMSVILTSFEKASTAALWKGLTVHSLPLSNSATLASSLELKLRESLSGSVQSGETVGIVGRALSLSRAVAEDGKGFSVSYVAGAQGFGLLSANGPVVL